VIPGTTLSGGSGKGFRYKATPGTAEPSAAVDPVRGSRILHM